MAKRTRKPPIKPELRREWLRLNEENGESPPQIAANDRYDVRTVRKQIEIAKQEREVREARLLVLRNALEHHYDDLRSYAEMLNSEISGLSNVPPSLDYDLMGAALRQHLPRSPIWSYMSKWHNLHQEKDERQQELEKLIEQQAKADRRLTTLVAAGMDMVVPGIIGVLAFQAKQWSQGYKGLNLKDNLVTEPAGEGFVNLRYGFSQMGKMDTEHAERYKEVVRDVLDDLESSLRDWEAYHDLEKTVAEIGRLGRKLREELAVIRLRRIVPGRCKYCPL
ncbi:MAG: hypothetical protein IBX36_00395 [Dehalococcoidia bacterium]|nr:hypothetical protein [Dehalococcoidia bacterium]